MIKSALESVPGFMGVFAADGLPEPEASVPCFLVVNTDVAAEPGEHWVAIGLQSGGRGVFFNSFGLPPLVPEIQDFIRKHAPNQLQFCNIVLQDAKTQSCGYYCIAFVKHMARGGTLQSFVGYFTHAHGNIVRRNETLLAAMLRQLES